MGRSSSNHPSAGFSQSNLTPEAIDRVFVAVLAVNARAADLQVLALLEPDGVTTGGVAEYIWDHWLGEPEEPTQEQVLAQVERVRL